MSRHRNLKNFIEDRDEYDDFDPMEDDEASEDYYITQVISKYKKINRETILKALDDSDWDINATVKLLKAREEVNKGGKPGKQAAQPKPAQKIEDRNPKKQIEDKSVKGEAEEKKEKSVKAQTEEKKESGDRKSVEKIHEKAEKAAEEAKHLREKWNQNYPDIYPSITSAGITQVNLVVIGHVDAGKSTLMGHLLFLLGYVDSKTISKYEKDSKAIGKDSFHFAWVLDAGEEERQRGVTIDVGCGYFSTPNRNITLLDAPGHKDFIPNMISGAAQADAAVLVIDASLGEFEKGFMGEGQSHGQTKEHSHLARALGITYLIVAVNKLDTVNWDENRFVYIKSELESFLKRAGFKELFFVPISGLHGDNLKVRSSNPNVQWYTDPTLVELIDQIPLPVRSYQKPMRLCVMDSYKLNHGSIVGQVFSGRIEGGQVKVNDKVMISPCGVVGTVKHIEVNGSQVDKAVAGESVSVAVKDTSGDFALVVPGDVCSAFTFPIPLIKKFRAKVFTFDILFPITKGIKLVMFVQSLKATVQVTALKEQLDPESGKTLKTNPRCLTRNMTALVEIEADHKICLERFTSYKSLGRVLFRDRSETVMAGMVLELLE